MGYIDSDLACCWNFPGTVREVLTNSCSRSRAMGTDFGLQHGQSIGRLGHLLGWCRLRGRARGWDGGSRSHGTHGGQAQHDNQISLHVPRLARRGRETMR